MQARRPEVSGGHKGYEEKDRVTGYVCTSATGIRVTMYIIGKPKNPRCFRIERCPVPYLNQRNAWSDTVTFKKWFYDVFLPFICRHTSRPVALLMDNCGLHGAELSDPRQKVTIMTLPPNCTSLHQPMEMGIISTWKLKYRSLLIRAIVEDLETLQQRRDDSTTLKQGMRGLSEGHDPHLLDVAKMVEKSWAQVTVMTICRCWVKSAVLPRAMSDELNGTYGRMKNRSKDDDVKEIIGLISKLQLNIDRRDPFHVQVQESVTEDDVNYWLRLEEQEEIKDALVQDDLNSIDHDDDQTEVHEADNDDNEADEEDAVKLPLPPRSNLMRLLDQLEETALNSQIDNAIVHLRRARNAFREALRIDALSSNRQLLITEVMQPES